MPSRIVVLVPPSKGMTDGGRGAPWAPGTMSFPSLDEARATVLAALGPDSPVALAPTRTAIRRYDGVLYRELAWPTLPPEARRRLNRDLVVVSGLWGLVGPQDPIPAYRLEMSASRPPLGKLSTWWRPRLTEALAPRVRGAVVWDLLPNEHAAAWSPAALRPRRRITVRFLDEGGRTVSHWNKLLKGSLVRWIGEHGVTDPAALEAFRHPQGYRFDAVSSDLDADPAVVVLRVGDRPPRPAPSGGRLPSSGPSRLPPRPGPVRPAP